MTVIFLYLVALGLFILGGFLMRNTSLYSKSYKRKKTRRIVGEISLIAAGVFLILAAFCQFMLSF